MGRGRAAEGGRLPRRRCGFAVDEIWSYVPSELSSFGDLSRSHRRDAMFPRWSYQEHWRHHDKYLSITVRHQQVSPDRNRPYRPDLIAAVLFMNGESAHLELDVHLPSGPDTMPIRISLRLAALHAES